jgi:hypothetical protein
MNANHKYKASVFSAVFGSEKALRELYPALSDKPLSPDEPIAINTLDDVLFMDQINDLSFTVGDRLVVLIEHQSTINPNMALRLFLYAAAVYKKIVDSDALYSSRMIPLPRPEFFVLYNGEDPQPDSRIYKLSDSFAGADDPPRLELEVTVYNVNEGRNAGILDKCETLKEYAAFVAAVRRFAKTESDINRAMRAAVEYCAASGILVNFLKEHGTEVINMITGWDWDRAKIVWQREAREDGLIEGRLEGRLEGEKKGLQKGVQQSIVKLLRFGLSPADIAKALEMPEAEVLAVLGQA